MKKNKDYIFPDKRIIWFGISRNWKLILLFTIIWFLICTVFLLTSSMGLEHNLIASSEQVEVDSSGTGYSYPMGFGYNLESMVLGTCGTIFFGFVSIIVICFNFYLDIRNQTMIFWMSKSISRIKIVSSKIFSSIIQLLIISLPGLISCFALYFLNEDSKKYFWYFCSDILFFLIYIIFLFSFFLLIFYLLINKGYLWIVILSLILLYFSLISFANHTFNDSPDHLKKYEFIQYLNFEFLDVKNLKFNAVGFDDILSIKSDILFVGDRIKPNKFLLFLSPAFMLSFIITSLWLCGFTFNKLNLKLQ